MSRINNKSFLGRIKTSDEKENFKKIKNQTALSGPESAAALKIGTRIVRGVDWDWGDQDGPSPGEGTTVTEIHGGWVDVLWDTGAKYCYRMESDGKYELKLADPLPIQEDSLSHSMEQNDLLALSENLKSIFLEKDESDITIKVGDQEYPAHRIIIRARSPVFYAMLQHNMKEKCQGFIDIPDCDPHIFRDFLLYLYTGKLDSISHDNVFELYYMSDKYEVIELKMKCVDFMSSNLNVDRICDVIALAMKHSERDLLNHATDFFIENTKQILLTVSWQKFVKEYPVEANELFIKTYNKVSEK